MKRLLNSMIFAASSMILLCCESPYVPESESGDIRITADLGEVTRAVSEYGIYKSFEVGDKISLFVWTGIPSSGALTSDQTVVNNVLNSFKGASEWTPEIPMKWAESADGTPVEHAFAAVYPPVDLKMPGILQGSYQAVDGMVEDVLVARVDSQLPTDEQVRLRFDHVMAALEVKLTFRSEYQGVDPASVYVTVEAATDADVDYLEAVSRASGPASEYRLSASADGLTHSAVLPEQTLPMNIVVHFAGETRILKPGVDLILESGRRSTINLAVGKDLIELVGISAGPWIDGGSESVETDEMTDTPIEFNVAVAEAEVRSGYEEGPLKTGMMGFYMQTAGADDADTRYRGVNRKLEFLNEKWELDGSPLLWKNKDAEVSWYAYYPYNENDVVDGIITVTIPTDQAKDGVLDLLYAKGVTTGMDSKEDGIKVELKHVMSKFIVNLTAGTELGEVEFESVVITDLDTQNKFNLSNDNSGYNTGYFIFAGDKPADINMMRHEGGKTFEAIVFPGTPSYIGLEINLKDGRIFYYKQGTPKFEMGMIHTLNLKVGNDKAETTSADIITKAWTE